MLTPVIAIIDIGKTNKKLFLFNQQYGIVYEHAERLAEATDDDGDACEDVMALERFIKKAVEQAMADGRFMVKAINFSAYGASFVYIGAQGRPVAPLYNYLKPYAAALQQLFYQTYGGEEKFSLQTASPVLGNLNSGMQLYWLKHTKPQVFSQVQHALHLPQYASFVLSKKPLADITSIGCHTNLWNFAANDYHEWVSREGIHQKLPPIASSFSATPVQIANQQVLVGVGLHDSSAALIPYLKSFHEPFVLISTGTWCISLNPFNQHPLTSAELQHDCLCYITYDGKQIKASRLFAGYEHEAQVQRIANHFTLSETFYSGVAYNADLAAQLRGMRSGFTTDEPPLTRFSVFAHRDLNLFADATAAYHQLMMDIVQQQHLSTQLVLTHTSVNRIFVDGGFGNNPLYMNLLAESFPHMKVFAAEIPQATALGAALAIHNCWNPQPIPNHLVRLKRYGTTNNKD